MRVLDDPWVGAPARQLLLVDGFGGRRRSQLVLEHAPSYHRVLLEVSEATRMQTDPCVTLISML